MKSHFNRFLVNDLKVYFLEWNKNVKEIPEHFPKTYKERIYLFLRFDGRYTDK